MKKKALLKDTLREIHKSLGRFISIFMIVAIGVAFFAGVRASVPDMKGTADKYFDDYNLMDYRIMSTIGMTKDDVRDLKEVKGIEGVYGSHSMDVINMRNNEQRVFKLMSMPMNVKQDDKNYINQIRVLEGRLPIASNECVIERDTIHPTGLQLGDLITFTSGTDEDISEALKQNTFKIVGVVNMPYYLSYEKGSSTIGSGVINNYAIIPEDNFKGEYYTEIFATAAGAKALNSYDDVYFDHIKPVTRRIKSVVEKNVDTRFDDIKAEAMKKIKAGRKEYNANKKLFDEQIEDAKQALKDGKRELEIGQRELDDNKLATNDMFREQTAIIRENERELERGKRELEQAKIQFDIQSAQAETKLNDLKTILEYAKQTSASITDKKAEVDKKLENPDLTDIERSYLERRQQDLVRQLKAADTIVVRLQQEYDGAIMQLETAKQMIETSEKELIAGEKALKDGKKQLAAGKKKAQKALDQAQAQIDQGYIDLEVGEKELAIKEKDGLDQLKKAKEKLDQGEADIKELKGPDCYILDRHSHYSYMDYGSAADRMGAISKVFPLFFFLVAALVCLTTMTRMVDEQRQQIGTLKALGYTKLDIAKKYIIYASIASVSGGIFGAVVGMILFPTVIYNAWGIMYNMPEVQLQAQIPLALAAIAIASFITIMAAVGACYKELVEVPSQLMRPKAPKNGKKIFLEHIPFIWSRFNFIHKVTARNIFRYKKRFFMTVVGISGCTALLVAGFGIQDSIGDIAVSQYQEIYKFDMSVSFDENEKLSVKEKLLEDVRKQENVKEANSMAIYHGLYADDGDDKGIDLYIPSDADTFEDYFTLRTRGSEEPIELADDGVIISEKVAKLKGLSVDDTFEVDNGDGVKRKLRIAGITEHYVGHVAYMTRDYYKEVYHRTPSDTTIFAKLNDTSDDAEKALGNKLMSLDEAKSVTFYSGIAESFEDTIDSLNIIIIVMIISAGLLAFVVLYNLTNVNISERLREIATIKVLGFYDKEVSAYVYRENIILTLIGSFVGIFVGIGLHALIMNLAELETVMFGRNIYKISFVYAIVITMIFAIMVNLVMYRKLKKIPMVESLKSVE